MTLPSKYNPWPYFLIWVISLWLLSYFHLDASRELAISLLGLALPSLLAFWKAPPVSASAEPFPQENRPPLPASAWPFLLLLVAASFLRLKDLTTLSAWPDLDEGGAAFYALEAQRGHWRFFYPIPQVPPAFFWLLGLYFKFIRPSLFSAWLFPALLSVFSVGLGYLALRTRFPAVFSLIYLTLLSVSFWDLYTGRFCIYLGLLFFWEMLAFWILAVFFNRSGSPQGPFWAVLLGLVAGAGLFVAISWPIVLAMLALAVYGVTAGKGKKGIPQDFLWFSAGTFIFCSLFLAAALHEKYGQYISGSWVFGRGWNGWATWRDCFLNFGAIFADPQIPFRYGPVWGGLLNPLEGALVLAGLVECRRKWRDPLLQWVALGSVLFLVPGLVSRSYDPFRMLQALPLLLFLATTGWMALVPSPSNHRKIFTAAGILALSAGLNLYHLWGPYHGLWGVPNENWYLFKSPEFYRAYQILEPLEREQGPGAVLSDLWSQTGDQTLELACYAFDAAHNPAVPLDQVRWVAVLADPNYKPFLAKDFPQNHWYWLGNLYPLNTGLTMAVLPVTPQNRGRLLEWLQANQALEPATSCILNFRTGSSQENALDLLRRAYASIGRDPFLQSCFWEKVYVRQAAANNPSGMLEALNRGLQKGYPLAQFYNDKGMLLAQAGRAAEARECFQKALRAALNLTSAAQNLDDLDKKTNP